MRKSTIFALLCSATVLWAGAGQAETRSIRLSNGVTDQHPNAKGVEAFSSCLAEKSKGELKVQAFWAGALGGDLQAVQALRSGTQEMAVSSTSALTGVIKEYGVYDLPYLFRSSEESEKVLDGAFGEWLNKRLADAGLVLVSNWETGFRQTTNSKHPITKVEDMAGLKIRLQQSQMSLDTFKLLGANPVAMAFGEVYAALETGAIDGQENAYAQIETSGIADVQKFVSATGHTFGIHLLLFSKPIFDSYSAEEQQAILDCGKASSPVQRKADRDAETVSLEKLKAKGLAVNVIEEAELEKFRERTKPIHDQYRDKIGAEVVDRMDAELAKIRGN